MKKYTCLRTALRRSFCFFLLECQVCDNTQRPGKDITYTSNWLHEQLVGNTQSANLGLWSPGSVIYGECHFLLAGIGALVWYQFREEEENTATPEINPLFNMKPIPSMKATAKYFYVVIILFLLQIGLGSIPAHYAVEG